MAQHEYDRDRNLSPRPHNARRVRKRKLKLLFRRTLIVLVGIVIVSLAILLLVKVGQTLMGQTGREATADEPAPTAEPIQKYQAALSFLSPDIPDDKKAEGYYSQLVDGVYIYNNEAYYPFSPGDYAAENYANSISEFKRKSPDVTVYNLLVPTHIEFGVPSRLVGESVATSSQADFIRTVFESYSADIIPVNCYNKLCEHIKEYNYFHTDGHWTGLGAYYGYAAFCEQSGNRTLNLGVCSEHVIDGYEGPLVYADDALYSHLDAVHYWTFPYDTYAERTDSMGDEAYQIPIYYEGEEAGPYAFGVFIWNSSALFVEHNEALDNGRKIAVVKDSFGNPFVPYLTADYEEVHVIDYDYYSGKLKTYLRDNSIDTVLFLNSVETAADSDEVVTLRELF